MDRRKLIQTFSAAMIVAGAAGCQESGSPGTTTAPSDTDAATDTTATDLPTTTEGTEPTPTPTPTQTPPPTPEPTPAPLAGDTPADIDEHVENRARVIREFLPDTSSASLAVALPTADTDQKQAYCFDAVNCYLRYAWTGDFLSIAWVKEDGPADILGDRYYTTSSDQVLRFGNPSAPPETRAFDGYSMWDGYPTFHYELDGVAVDHRIVAADGGPSLQHHFELEGADSSVFFVTDGTADYDASAGEWTDGTLEVPADAADSFTVTAGVSQ
jgi:hypothetical protein